MNHELQDYYESLFSMFSSKGWGYFIEDLKKIETEVSNIRTATDAQSLYFRRGQIDILDLVLNRKEVCEKVFDQLQEDSDAPNV